MTTVRCQISVSLDGFVAGPNQTPQDPLGEGGLRLHEWMFPPPGQTQSSVDAEVTAGILDGVGAFIMGRNMFTPGRGEWDETWHGWWGEDPPFHQPVFVLTHHPRPPLPMKGDTTFTFVTDGIESALAQARSAAGHADVMVAGGAATVRQFLAAGLLDELYLHIVPIVLGSGERFLQGVGDPVLEPVEVIASPHVTHIRYRIDHPAGQFEQAVAQGVPSDHSTA